MSASTSIKNISRRKLENAVFFDLDGTLLDISERYFRLFTDFCAQHEFSSGLTAPEYWSRKRGGNFETQFFIDSGVPLAAEQWKAFQLDNIETEQYLKYDTVWPGIVEHLTALNKDHLLVLVTLRRRRRQLDEQLEQLLLDKVFSEVICAGENALPDKSERAKFKAWLVRARLPEITFRGWFVGDTETDIACGKNLGCRTVAATYGIQKPESLISSNPDIVFRTPAELLRWTPASTE